ncbi:MAG: Smr/MutS family protein [Alphaproteobacteria bacterium]
MAKKRLSEEDLALWQRIAANVRPLKQPAKLAPRRQPAAAQSAKPKPAAPAKAAPVKPKAAKPAPPVAAKPVPAPPSFDRRTATKLKRGRIAVEAKLDLHGMTQSEAHGTLRRFIAESREAGRRCVLVVTGVGRLREDGGPGVLRRSVPRWLAEHALAEAVLSFAPAEPRHGGAGALYVMLRRKR